MALAVVAALLRSFSPFSIVVWYIVGAAFGDRLHLAPSVAARPGVSASLKQ